MITRPLRIPAWPYIRRVADTTARDAMTDMFFGMTVFVVDLKQFHIWNGTGWDVVGLGPNSPDVLIDCGTITAPSENVEIDAGTIV